VTHEARPGVIWRRVVETPQGTVVHLINLLGQDEVGWDTPKAPIPTATGLRLRIRQTGAALPRVHTADPQRGPAFEQLTPIAEAGYSYADLPPLHAWQVVLIRRETEENR
jgi:dextranase